MEALAAEHRLNAGAVHFEWDGSLPPALVARSGDVLHVETREVSGGQVRYGGPPETVTQIDRSRTYPLAGPIAIEDARPGDVLEVEMLDISTGSWGWTAIFPGRGLLPEHFPDPYIRYFDLDGPRVRFAPGISIALAPFCGTIGVVPAAQGRFPVRPPHQGGGNIDTKQLTRGCRLYLPILVEGGLLSVGDGHAVQRDGEVCLTAIECDLSVTMRLTLVHGRSLAPGTYQIQSPAKPAAGEGRLMISGGVGPDLRDNAKRATIGLIDWLRDQKGLSAQDAYLLCSLAADLRISQIVNEPNWGVTASLPESIFEPSNG